MRAIALIAIAAVLVACTAAPSVATPSPSASASLAAASPTSTAVSGLDAVPVVESAAALGWHTTPNKLNPEDHATVVVRMPAEAVAGQPRARVRATGETVPLTLTIRTGPQWSADISYAGLAPGEYPVDFVVRMRDGSDRVAATASLRISAPIYVVWTLDFEGDAATNETLDNTYLINRSYFAPLTLMWNPRVWTTNAVSAERADVMRQWALSVVAAGQGEIALHLHAWTDFVRAAGLAPRISPSWAARGDGYDVPLTAFDEAETAKLLDYALRLMSDHGMPRPTSFRGGGLFANAANLRAIAAAGFTVDSSATPSGPFGALQLPWTLPAGAQPYRPSRTDANAPGDLPLLEVPNNAGNTYGYTTSSIQRIINDDLAMLPRPGEIAAKPIALTFVSHPATIDATERAAIEKLFAAFEPYRLDRQQGPLRFVTLSQLAKALAP